MRFVWASGRGEHDAQRFLGHTLVPSADVHLFLYIDHYVQVEVGTGRERSKTRSADCALPLCAPKSSRATEDGGSSLEKLNFNFIRDIAPVAGLMQVPNVVVVHPSVPAKTIPEFITYAKANPGKINMASGGNGTLGGHIAGELFKIMANIDMLHVPYRGNAPALTDLLSGRVQIMFVATTSAIEFVRAGRLRPLAVTSTATEQDGLLG